ncbi:unnamed protein product [Somion occarium]|uniref:Uncharacterized protein n=1 Tax=Somion occarium TaxID=3059160 RepID=A0ABP1E609_9APHY
MSTSEVDIAFSLLPVSVRDRIDHAFDSALESTQATQPWKRREPESNDTAAGGFISNDTSSAGGFIMEEPTPGGFIIDEPAPGGSIVDSESPSAGGFIRDDQDSDEETSDEEHNRIPLSLIPTALQLLDLQPDDEDVLAVFRNAASGWSERSRTSGGEDEEQFVSRKDWRAVCAALMDTGDGPGDDEDRDVEMRMDDDNEVLSEEEYNPSDTSSSEAGEDDDDEYNEGGFIPTKAKGKQAASKWQSRSRAKSDTDSLQDSDFDDLPNTPKRITPRQRADCRRTFALFFPNVEDKDLDRMRIMIRDVSRVATLLKEKITAEEIVEMLEAFSSSADKSMKLADFEKMMIAAKLA